MTLRITADDRTHPAVLALLEAHFAGMLANSPEDSCHFLDLGGLGAADVSFWTIWDGDALAGMGALRQIDATHGEVKSMRTHADHLRKGAAAAMLAHIMAAARDRGMTRLSLETGSGAAFEPAIALYRAHGFVDCPPFADYRPDPFSRFMTRLL